MPIKPSKSSKKKGLKVDFTDVETRVLLPEGEYRAKVKAVEEAESESSGSAMLKWQFSIIDDDKKLNNQTAYYITSLQPQALWNLRNLLETLGVETPNGKFELDIESYIGLELLLTIEHDTYEGKKHAKVSDFSPMTAATDDEEEEESEEEEVEEEEEEAEDEEEEEAEVTAEEVKAMKLDELTDLAKKFGISKPSNMPKKLRAQVLDALEKNS